MSSELPKPGVYPDVAAEEYFSWPAVSNSALSYLQRSPAHFRLAMAGGVVREETKEMRLGTLCHAGRFEPLSLAERYAVMPRFEDKIRKPDGSKYDKPKSSAAYKAEAEDWIRANPEKIIVSEGEYRQMVGVVRSIEASERARYAMTGQKTDTEVSIVWNDPDTGIVCKARIDFVNYEKRILVDLKTTADASGWEWTIKKREYNRQFAFYRDGWEVLHGEQFRFENLVAEVDPPYCVRCAPMSEESLDAGRERYKSFLEQIRSCTISGEWPGYDDPDAWHFESKEDPINLVIGGQTVSL